MAKNAKKSALPDELVQLYDRLVASYPDIERKGVSLPYTSVNGNMFSFLSAEGIFALRLSDNDRTEFCKQYSTNLMLAHGVIMKEYVAVPALLFSNTKELAPWFERSVEYVRSLKPKVTKKAASAKATKTTTATKGTKKKQ